MQFLCNYHKLESIYKKSSKFEEVMIQNQKKKSDLKWNASFKKLKSLKKKKIGTKKNKMAEKIKMAAKAPSINFPKLSQIECKSIETLD
jgi:hypothetical protein